MKSNIKNVRIEITDYLGTTKITKLEPEHIDAINKMYTVKENLIRLKAACKSYSNNGWVSGYVNNHKICSIQWAQL